MFESNDNASVLADALRKEHEVLSRVHEILSRSLPPDSGMSDTDVVRQLWEVREFDTMEALEAGARALDKVKREDRHLLLQDS